MAPVSILVVDDHRPDLVAIEAILGPLDHRIACAESAEAALRLLVDEEFAVILCDVRMPGMDGFEMIARLRAEGMAARTPVVLMSAIDMDREAIRRAYALGAVDLITKPLDPELIRWRIGALVSLYRRGEEGKRNAAPIAQEGQHTPIAHEAGDHAAATAHEAERLIRRQDTFVGILSHDLRSPLSAVLVGGRRLADATDLPAIYRRTAVRILKSATRMDRMIKDLLDLARTSSGASFPIRRRWANLEDVVTNVVQELAEAHPNRTIEVAMVGNQLMECDPDRMAQAIGNLLTNAVSHGDGEIKVEVYSLDQQVTIRVHNRGTPIPPETMATLFQPFRRGSSDSSGLGLGLYIVKEVVRAHGGTVVVQSSLADGTTVEMSWPRRPIIQGARERPTVEALM